MYTLYIFILLSVAHIPEHYTIRSTGITKTKHPEVLGRYSLMATSHQNVTSIIYKQDNGSFYLLNNTGGDWWWAMSP